MERIGKGNKTKIQEIFDWLQVFALPNTPIRWRSGILFCPPLSCPFLHPPPLFLLITPLYPCILLLSLLSMAKNWKGVTDPKSLASFADSGGLDSIANLQLDDATLAALSKISGMCFFLFSFT